MNTCKICQTLFKPGPGTKGIYCSKECVDSEKNSRGKYSSNPKKCKTCSVILPYEKRWNKFCSRSCSAIHTNRYMVRKDAKIYPPCKNCGKPTKDSNRKFCCYDCCALFNKKYKNPEEKLRMKRLISKEASANYRAKVRNQTPITANRDDIKEFYKLCPTGYEVDHIIPISKGGLHDLSNLQYLTISENRRKHNKIL